MNKKERRDYSKLSEEMIKEFLEDAMCSQDKRIVAYIWSDERNDLIPYEESKEFDIAMKKYMRETYETKESNTTGDHGDF